MSISTEHTLLPDTIPFSEFRADCSRILDRVRETGDTVTVTKNGRPVAVVAPCPKRLPSFWERYGEIISIAPGADIDLASQAEWGADWNPVQEIIG